MLPREVFLNVKIDRFSFYCILIVALQILQKKRCKGYLQSFFLNHSFFFLFEKYKKTATEPIKRSRLLFENVLPGNCADTSEVF